MGTDIKPGNAHCNHAFVVTNSAKLRSFHYKINMHALALNEYLFECGIKDHFTCYFCMDQRETCEHFFWHCLHAQSFWQKVVEIMEQIDKVCMLRSKE